MIRKMYKGDRLLEIDNGHIPDSGPPPSLDATDKYVGYFENPYGEQWVFIGDRSTCSAKLFGGDVGWDTAHAVSLNSPCPDLILNEPEKLWIITCFMAMSDEPFDDIVRRYNKASQQICADVESDLDDETEP